MLATARLTIAAAVCAAVLACAPAHARVPPPDDPPVTAASVPAGPAKLGSRERSHVRLLRYGASGTRVLKLNRRLGKLGYLPASAARTDRYTTATMHAVVAAQKWHGLARDGVAGPVTQRALQKASRPRTGSRGARSIEVLLDKQLALLIEDGRVMRTIAVSSGDAGHSTPAGAFRVFRKERMSWSVPYKTWLPWASYFNGGIAFHAYASVPPYPASHGCVRVPESFAREVYTFAVEGTPVFVRG